MTDEGLTPQKLRDMVRKYDHLMKGDDVIAVGSLFIPGKALKFSDEKGDVWAITLASWHQLKAAAPKDPPFGGPLLVPFGGMRVVFEHDGEAWRETVKRILRSMAAGFETSGFVSRIQLEQKLLRSLKAEGKRDE